MQTPAKWWRKCKRRKPGIYLARTLDHATQSHRENGYVGRSVSAPLRKDCHLGVCRHSKHFPKPWTDLDPVWRVLRLPWWLGWKWVLAPLELAAILLLLPRYNDQLNHANPRRVPISVQHQQRAQRAALPFPYRTRVVLFRLGRRVVQAAGSIAILAGLVITLWSNR